MTNIRIPSLVMIAVLTLLLSETSLSGQQDRQVQTSFDAAVTVTSFVEMAYPSLARMGRVEGDVVVRVKLDESGKVVSADAVSGYELLIKDAIINARKWRFRPNGRKTTVIVYEFRFAEGTCGASRSQLFGFRQPNIASIIACTPQMMQNSTKQEHDRPLPQR